MEELLDLKYHTIFIFFISINFILSTYGSFKLLSVWDSLNTRIVVESTQPTCSSVQYTISKIVPKGFYTETKLTRALLLVASWNFFFSLMD